MKHLLIDFPYDYDKAQIIVDFTENKSIVNLVANRDGMALLADWLTDFLIQSESVEENEIRINAGNDILREGYPDLIILCDRTMDDLPPADDGFPLDLK